MLAGLLLLAALPQEAPAASADPLAPARAGKIRCVSPNAANRTCQTIIRYTVRDDGGFDATVIGIVSRDPMVLLEYKSFGRIEEGGVCMMIRMHDFETGTLLYNGAPVGPSEGQRLRLQLQGAVQPIAGKKRCFRDQPGNGDDMLSVITLDGVAQPEMQQRVAWLSPEEGYAVGL